MLIFGDIHGAYKTLKALIAKCPQGEDLCFVGDLIDRGPGSREVVELVMSEGHRCVLGNHEDMALWHYGLRERRKTIYDMNVWIRNGGDRCLPSYPDLKISDKHLEFLDKLPLALQFTNLVDTQGRSLVVSHSGVAQGMNLTWATHAVDSTRDADDSIIWYRGEPEVAPNTFHVFGHTPHRDEVIRGNYANVDTGWHRKLTALRFPQMEIYEHEFIG